MVVKSSSPMKIYLDTNIFFSFLIKDVKGALKSFSSIRTDNKGNKVVDIPKEVSKLEVGEGFVILPTQNGAYSIKLFKNSINILTQNRGKNMYYASPLVFAEAMRKLRIEYSINKEDSLKMWELFANLLILQRTKYNALDFSNLEQIILEYPPRKNVQDLLHIMLAQQNDCWFLTHDKLDDNLKRIKESYYKRIMTFSEFKETLKKNQK